MTEEMTTTKELQRRLENLQLEKKQIETSIFSTQSLLESIEQKSHKTMIVIKKKKKGKKVTKKM
jgi:hypothetical protein